MKKNLKFGFAGIGIMLVMCAVFGAAVMLLWNALMPQIFGFPQLDYLQAAGLLILARILFGGLGSWKGHAAYRGAREGKERLFQHNNKLREKWMNMSEEERKEFIEKEKDFFKFNHRFSHFNNFFGDDEKKEGE
jgi:hypothetical protein